MDTVFINVKSTAVCDALIPAQTHTTSVTVVLRIIHYNACSVMTLWGSNDAEVQIDSL